MMTSRNDRFFKGGFSGLVIAAAVLCGASAAQAAGTLPSGYVELEYLESSGTQYINTGIVPKSTTRVVIDFSYTEAPSSSMAASGWVSGGKQFWFGIGGDGASLVRDLGSPCPGGLQDADRRRLPRIRLCGESRRSWPRNLRQVDE